MSETSWFFGYGSLVNCHTHDYPDPKPTTLKGWRRRWVQTPATKFCFLSANPIGQGAIDGLIARVPNDDWQALDIRETSYVRHPVGNLVDPPTVAEEIQAYSVPPKTYDITSEPKPILLSYLDVVLMGYDRVFGRDGVTKFIHTTDSWERPILNDRSAPIYPRHQTLSPTDQVWIDELLKTLPSHLI